MKEVIFYI